MSKSSQRWCKKGGQKLFVIAKMWSNSVRRVRSCLYIVKNCFRIESNSLNVVKVAKKMSWFFQYPVPFCGDTYYRVSQQVWNRLKALFWSLEMLASEASIVLKKICILLQKIAFSAFFVNCKKWIWNLKQLFSNF